jgi:hypothetical protein
VSEERKVPAEGFREKTSPTRLKFTCTKARWIDSWKQEPQIMRAAGAAHSKTGIRQIFLHLEEQKSFLLAEHRTQN